MARRRLEAAIEAGKAIDEGRSVSKQFTKLETQHTYEFDEMQDGVFCLQYNHAGNSLAVGYGDGSIEILTSKTGKLSKTIKKHKYGGLPISCVRYHPKEHHMFLAANVEGKVFACSEIDGSSKELITEQDNEINCLDFSLDGQSFATAGKDLDVRIYDVLTNQHVKTYSGYRLTSPDPANAGHAQRVFALKFHPEQNHILVTGGWDNHLKIWDLRTQEGAKRTIPGPHICGDSVDIKGTQILTGSWVASNALQLWEFGEGSLLQNIPFHHSGQGEFLYTAQFCDNDVVLAGGSGTNSVQAIDMNTSKMLGEVTLGRTVQALDSVHGGRMFAVGGGGTELHMGQLS